MLAISAIVPVAVILRMIIVMVVRVRMLVIVSVRVVVIETRRVHVDMGVDERPVAMLVRMWLIGVRVGAAKRVHRDWTVPTKALDFGRRTGVEAAEGTRTLDLPHGKQNQRAYDTVQGDTEPHGYADDARNACSLVPADNPWGVRILCAPRAKAGAWQYHQAPRP
jgi:hypothetical protein